MRLPACLVLGILLGWGPPLSADILYSVTDLGTLGGSASVGSGINNVGQVTGVSYTSAGAGFGHAFLYSNGQIRDLSTLPGLEYSAGSGINDAGQVTGLAKTSFSVSHAFLYSNGQMTDLGTLGGTYSYGNSINNAGQVTGYAEIPSSLSHAFLYSNGQMTDLGTLGGSVSFGSGINNAGQVVGEAATPGNAYPYRAFLYSNGQMYDLNTLIDPALHLTLNEATAINDQGQIVANNVITNRAYLLSPVPEPGTWALCGLSLGLLVAAVRYRRTTGGHASL